MQQTGQQAQSVLTTLLAQSQITWVATDEVYLKDSWLSDLWFAGGRPGKPSSPDLATSH